MRLRNAAIPPVAAFVLVHVYFSMSLAIGFRFRFGIAAAILFAGAFAGIVQIVRAARAERIRGVAIGWLIFAIAAIVVCVLTLIGILFPS